MKCVVLDNLIVMRFTDMYVDNGVVQIICSIIINMEKTIEDYHHELFLSSLNQLLRMSPGRVKEICSSTKDLKQALLSLQNSYPNDSNYQARLYNIILNKKNYYSINFALQFRAYTFFFFKKNAFIDIYNYFYYKITLPNHLCRVAWKPFSKLLTG